MTFQQFLEQKPNRNKLQPNVTCNDSTMSLRKRKRWLIWRKGEITAFTLEVLLSFGIHMNYILHHFFCAWNK